MEQTKKRVLMFCVSFFDYEKRIADAIRNVDCIVDLYDERPNNSFIAKTCIRYNIGLYRPALRKYYRQIIEETKNVSYDYILVVKGEAVNEEILNMLRKAHPEATFILYLWDSVVNIPDCEKRMRLYDRVLTFDPQDAKKYNIPYIPIPYDSKSFSFASSKDYCYDIAFIGTAHSVRPRVVKQIAEQCRAAKRNCFVYFYSPHILVYLFNKLTNPDYRWITLKDIHFQALSSEQVNRIYASSRCILDVEHPKQSGATTRPIEMLPMKKKIISTNCHVKDFPFYNQNNFFIIDRDHPEINEEFFESEYLPVQENVVYDYSPERFAKIILDTDKATQM